MRKWEQREWDSVLGRMLALLFSSPCFPCLSSTATAVQRERQREKGNFSIAEAVRQETGERENKSAPVWSLVTTRGKGIVQEDRGGVGEGSDYRGIMSFYCMSLCTRAPVCRLTVAALI